MIDVLGMRISVLGAGLTGREVTTFLTGKGAFVTVYDENQISDNSKILFDSLGIEYFENVDFENIHFDADLIVKSPGIPWKKGILDARKRSIPVVDEMEVAGWYISYPIIGITGTNGKSTTVALLAKILEEAGFKVFLGGNYGEPLVKGVDQPYDVAVVEVSSFQLEGLVDLRFWISGILNITTDHLKWHGSFENYVNAKKKIVELTGNFGEAWINIDDPVLASLNWREFGGKVKFYSKFEKDVDLFLSDNQLMFDREKQFLRPVSNIVVEDLLMAIAVSLSWGVDYEVIENAVESFRGLPHRMEKFFEINGITFIDDSKSTNPASVQKALEVFSPEETLLLLGGQSKGEGYELLKELLKRCKYVVFFGRDGEELSRIFLLKRSSYFSTLKEAVEHLKKLVETIQPRYVLLSPGCASFDEFKNFKERGNFFKEEVKKLYEQM